MTHRLAQPVVGFREWRVVDGRLVALNSEPWPPGVVRARCRRDPSHAVPREDCGCGLHALHHSPTCSHQSVLGAVVAWGALIVHPDGFRAQYARPIAIAMSAGVADRELRRVLRDYDLRLVAPAALQAYAREFGSTISRDLLPCPDDLLHRLADALDARDRCRSGHHIFNGVRFELSVLHRLATGNARGPLSAALVAAWHATEQPMLSPDETCVGMAALRTALRGELGRVGPRHDITTRLRVLDVAHGPVRAQVARLVARGYPPSRLRTRYRPRPHGPVRPYGDHGLPDAGETTSRFRSAQDGRLAAERQMRLAISPASALDALALLPGDEARAGLHRQVEMAWRLRSGNPRGHDVWRVWDAICLHAHLADLLDTRHVRRALADPRLTDDLRVRLLRQHPTADPAAAVRLWRTADLNPRFPAWVLPGCGAHRAQIVRESLEEVHFAVSEQPVAARLAAVIALEGEGDWAVRDVARRVAVDDSMPATLRAVAAWTTGHPDTHANPVLNRYGQWRRLRAPKLDDPLDELLSGQWLDHTLL